MTRTRDPYQGMVMVYGAPSAPEDPFPDIASPLVPFVPFVPNDPLTPETIADAIRKSANNRTFVINPPPPEADTECRAIAVLAALDDAARTRVLRYAASRWGEK